MEKIFQPTQTIYLSLQFLLLRSIFFNSIATYFVCLIKTRRFFFLFAFNVHFCLLLQALLQHGPPDQCFHSCRTPPSAHPQRGEPLSRWPRPPRPVTFLHFHLSRPPGLQYRCVAPQGQRTLGSAHPAEHPACRSRREGGVLNTAVTSSQPFPPVPLQQRASQLASRVEDHPFVPLEAHIDRPCYLMFPPTK